MIINQQPALLASLGDFQVPASSIATAQTLAQLLAALTPAAVIPAGARVAVLQAQAQNIRYTTDGVLVPTATIGFLLVTTMPAEQFSSLQFNKLQLIQAASGAAMTVGFYG